MENNVDIMISKYPSELCEKIQSIRDLIKSNYPDAIELLSYWVPAFKLWKQTFLYAWFKNHIWIYPGPEIIENFKDKLEWYETSKWTIKFSLNKELDYELILDIVKGVFW